MTSPRQHTKTSIPQPTLAKPVVKTSPAPLDQAQLKAVAGGVGASAPVVNLPRGTW